MRLIFRLSILMVLIFGIFNVIAVAAGHTQPPNPILDGFQIDCANQPQPCWYGVRPGITHEDELLQRMAFAQAGRYIYDDFTTAYIIYFVLPDDLPACMFSFHLNQELVTSVEISLCHKNTLYVGDVTLISSPALQSVSLTPYNVVYGGVSLNIGEWPDPISPVSYINLLSHPERLAHYEWHGFMPLWRYCQLEAEYPLCS